MRAARSRVGTVLGLAAGITFVITVVALAQSSDTGETPAEGGDPNSSGVPELVCPSGTMIGESTFSYVRTTERQDAASALSDFLEGKGYDLSASDFTFSESGKDATGAWAIPAAESQEAPRALAVLSELSPGYWGLVGFSSCEVFDQEHMTEAAL